MGRVVPSVKKYSGFGRVIRILVAEGEGERELFKGNLS
jgi:hypothetical protein